LATQYRVYANDFAGGPVDYTTPVYDGPLLAYSSAPLPPGSDAAFAVRAYDDVTGLEEQNVTARYEIKTGPAGEDLTNAPPAVPFVSAVPYGNGAVAVSWLPVAPGAGATTYNVYGGTPSVSYGSPLATEAHFDGAPAYRTVVSGLTAGSPYEFTVVAEGPAGEGPPSHAVKATPLSSTGPEAPPLLSGSAGWIDRF
jgi:hypothetical protein